MAYIKRGEALVITDASKYSVKEAEQLIKEFRENNPNVEGFSKRSDKNFLREWAVHALAYRWGFMKSKAKDAFLQFDMDPEVKLMYDILGPIAILILKFYKK
jgi:hypothetical protein